VETANVDSTCATQAGGEKLTTLIMCTITFRFPQLRLCKTCTSCPEPPLVSPLNPSSKSILAVPFFETIVLTAMSHFTAVCDAFV
jgi:hypothetical protein